MLVTKGNMFLLEQRGFASHSCESCCCWESLDESGCACDGVNVTLSLIKSYKIQYTTTNEDERAAECRLTHPGAAVDEGLSDLQHVCVFGELQEIPLKLFLVFRHLTELHLQPLKLLLDYHEVHISV